MVIDIITETIEARKDLQAAKIEVAHTQAKITLTKVKIEKVKVNRKLRQLDAKLEDLEAQLAQMEAEDQQVNIQDLVDASYDLGPSHRAVARTWEEREADNEAEIDEMADELA